MDIKICARCENVISSDWSVFCGDNIQFYVCDECWGKNIRCFFCDAKPKIGENFIECEDFTTGYTSFYCFKCRVKEIARQQKEKL